jgi:sn1-specific diacylglycerol lipase
MQIEGLEYYKLIVTGHSLGAGAAVLLAMMLKAQYPEVKCIGFGPPGSTLDIESCRGKNTFMAR